MRCFPWIQAAILTGLAGLAGWAHLSRFEKRAIIESTVARHVAKEAASAQQSLAEPVNGATNQETEAPDLVEGIDETDPSDAAPAPEAGVDESEPPAPVTERTPPSFDLDSMAEEIGVAEAKWIFDQNLADFIDARNAPEFEAGHIPGAFSIPPRAIQGSVPKVIDDGYLMPGERPIVIYCEGGDCDASHLVRDHLQHMGFGQRILILVDGYPAWADAGHPTEAGPDPFGGDQGGG